jgi:hypothetical protein
MEKVFSVDVVRGRTTLQKSDVGRTTWDVPGYVRVGTTPTKKTWYWIYVGLGLTNDADWLSTVVRTYSYY